MPKKIILNRQLFLAFAARIPAKIAGKLGHASQRATAL